MAPSPSEILTERLSSESTFNGVARRGVLGVVYSGALLVLAIITGFVEIVQDFLLTTADGVGGVWGAFLNGLAGIIQAGALDTQNNLFSLGPFGFIEALFLTFLAIFVVQQANELFSTDIFFIPGFDIIPFFGEEADDD